MSSAGRVTSEEESTVGHRLKECTIHVAIPVDTSTKVRESYKNNLEWLTYICEK